MNKKILSNILIPIVFLWATGCGIYTHTFSYSDPNVSFKSYKTFAWLPDSGMTAKKDSFRNSAYDNDIIRNNAKNFIVYELGKRGMTLDLDTPDALFQLVVRNEKKQIIHNNIFYSSYYYRNRFYYPYYYPYYDYYTYYGWGCQNNYCDHYPYEIHTYITGTITLNMFDRKSKKLIWMGSAEGNVYDPSYIYEDVHPAVKRIMKNFPIARQ